MKSKPVCPNCASDDICIDAVAKWDASISDWSLAGTQDTMTCQACENEFEVANWVEMKPEEETAE